MVSDELKASLDKFRDIICDVEATVRDKLSSKLKEKLELAGKNINKITGLVSDFLDISRIDADQMKLELTKLDLNLLISEVLEELSPLAAQKHIALENTTPDA